LQIARRSAYRSDMARISFTTAIGPAPASRVIERFTLSREALTLSREALTLSREA